MGALKSGERVECVKSLWEENVILSMDYFFCSVFVPSVEFHKTSMLLCSSKFPAKALSFDQAKYVSKSALFIFRFVFQTLNLKSSQLQNAS